ncbi:MAG: hypothetical protein AAB410_01565 [Patescibacteria group bacterium]
MITYDRVKKWGKEHKKEIYTGACFVVVFFVGFGTGRYDKEAQNEKRKTQSNYSKTLDNQQKGEAGKAEVVGDTVKNQTENNLSKIIKPAAVAGDKACVIKGNINSQGRKLYHVPGGAFYERTNPEMCFNTEDEAQAAGFTKSAR